MPDTTPPRRRLRVGASWSKHGGLCTVVAEGTGPADAQGRRPDDRLVAVAETPELAALIVNAVNAWVTAALTEDPR